MIIQVNKSDRISFDILRLEQFVVVLVVQDRLESLSALDVSLSAIQAQFPNLVVDYLITPKDIQAEDLNLEPEEIVAELLWIKVYPAGQMAGGQRLESLLGEQFVRALGWRQQTIIARSLKQCYFEIASN